MPSFTLTNDADAFPGAGADTRGDDEIFGLDGNDDINAGRGDDVVDGGEGDDLLKGAAGADTLDGGAGADRLYGGIDNDTLHGGDANDTLWGQGGDDALNGGAGDDLMYGGEGGDVFHGGEGYDTVSFRYAAGPVSLQLDGAIGAGEAAGDSVTGVERFVLSNFADLFQGGADAATVLGGGGDDGIMGSAASDVIYGGAGDDTLAGADGDDRIFGDTGDDVLTGGYGDDVLHDLVGAATAYGDQGKDRITINTGDAYGGDDDDVLSAGGAGVSGLRLYGGDGADRLYGSNVVGSQNELHGGEGDDALYGGLAHDEMTSLGSNTLYGGAGDDRLQSATRAILDGGVGNDWINGAGGGGDQIEGGDGVDTISYASMAEWIELTAAGAAITGRFGAAHDDIITGVERVEITNGDDLFDAGLSSVGYTVYGLGGADTMYGSGEADAFYGGDGNDELTGGSGDDILHAGAGETDVLRGGTGADRVYLQGGDAYGGADDDVLSAFGAGQAWLLGEDGADKLYGSTDANGVGTLGGGAGDDIINGRAGFYTASGGAGDDRIFIDNAMNGRTLRGEAGDDYMQGAATGVEGYGDRFNGGADIDTVSYRNATAGIVVSNDPNANTGAATNDTFTSIEVFLLTNFADEFGYLVGAAAGGEVRAGGGDDVVYGSDHADAFHGQAGYDTLEGWGGDDVLNAGADGGVLTGGAGADTFVFGVNHAQVAITDFALGLDLLDLATLVAANATYVISSASGNAHVEFSTGDILQLNGLSEAQAQDLVDNAYGGSPAPASRVAPESFDTPAPREGWVFTFAHGEWLLAG